MTAPPPVPVTPGRHAGGRTTPEDASPTVLSRRRLLGAVGAAGLGTLVGAPALAAPPVQSAEHLPEARTIQRLALRSFRRIKGVPVYYGLQTSPRTWYCTDGFYDRLGWWMNTLKSWSSANGYGSIASIGSAGFYVNKSGQHGAGTAMDLSIVRWAGGRESIPFNGHHASSNRTRRRRYFAVEATLRKQFRYVLDGNYNADHANHFHVDVAALPNRRLLHSSRADTVFVQAVCNNFLGSGIAVDGAWGPSTQGQVSKLKQRLDVSGDLQRDRTAVRHLLRGIADAGFRDRGI